MQRESESDYYRRREAVVRRQAEAAHSPAVRLLHDEMADRYAAKAAELDGGSAPAVVFVPR